MPIEVVTRAHEPERYEFCPRCCCRFESFLRFMVARSPWPRWWWPFGKQRPVFAVICRCCKQIVGWE